MSYTRPTFADLQARIAADLAVVPAALRGPLTASWARACHGLHGNLDWVQDQISPLTCELERLHDWAALYGVDRLLATFAAGSVTVHGTAGSVLYAGVVMRGSNGLDYVVRSSVTVPDGGSAVASVRCTSAGVLSNLQSGQVLTFVSAVAGLSSSATVTADGLTGGADDELVDDWRARVADEWRTLVLDGARGGKLSDYVYWAKAAHPSVTGALVQSHGAGVGSIVVRPICNGLVDRLPTQQVLSAVKDLLLREAPPGDVRVLAPIVHPVSVRIVIGPAYNSQANQTAINESLIGLINSKMTDGDVISRAEIDEAVSMVTSQFSRVAPVADVVSVSGEVFVLRELLWS